MALRERLALAAGLGLAGLGVGAFVAAGPAGVAPSDQPGPSPTTADAGVVTLPETEAGAFEVPGIAQSVARVLSVGGFAVRDDGSELSGPVRRVLEGRGTVLTVEESP